MNDNSDPRLQIGGNRPPRPVPPTLNDILAWLDHDNSALVERRTDVCEGLDNLPMQIASDDDEGRAAENVRIARALLKLADEKREKINSPYVAAWKGVNDLFKRFAAPIQERIDRVDSSRLLFSREQERLKREAAAAAAKEAQRLADEAAEKAQAAARKAPPEVADEAIAEATAAADAAAKAAEQVDARPAEFTRVTGPYGTVSSMRRTWTYQYSLAKVPREYLMIDDAKVKAAAKARDPKTGRPLAVIPGIVWVPVDRMGQR